jgi:putative Ca2+/H+ antiporter (TMEM165/GDT1 family)
LDALLTSFIAAGLAEWGDKTQLLVAALAARYGRPGPVLAGVALAALANALLAAAGGVLVHGHITVRAVSLLLALALVFAGAAAFGRKSTPTLAETVKGGAFLGSLIGFFLVEFGDKTQFVTFAVSAQFDALLLAAAGATGGVVAASVPAALLGPALARHVPVRAVRYGAGILFLIVGIVVAVNALRLV